VDAAARHLTLLVIGSSGRIAIDDTGNAPLTASCVHGGQWTLDKAKAKLHFCKAGSA